MPSYDPPEKSQVFNIRPGTDPYDFHELRIGHKGHLRVVFMNAFTYGFETMDAEEIRQKQREMAEQKKPASEALAYGLGLIEAKMQKKNAAGL